MYAEKTTIDRNNKIDRMQTKTLDNKSYESCESSVFFILILSAFICVYLRLMFLFFFPDFYFPYFFQNGPNRSSSEGLFSGIVRTMRVMFRKCL